MLRCYVRNERYAYKLRDFWEKKRKKKKTTTTKNKKNKQTNKQTKKKKNKQTQHAIENERPFLFMQHYSGVLALSSRSL